MIFNAAPMTTVINVPRSGEIRHEFSEDEFRTIDAIPYVVAGSCHQNSHRGTVWAAQTIKARDPI